MPANNECCILIPLPANGRIEPEVERAVSQLAGAGYGLKVHTGWAIDIARSVMASDALAEGYQELMWIDSDVLFDPNDVERLRASKREIICGIYTKKGLPELACRFLPSTQQVQLGAGGGEIEIEYAGTGFLYTRRSVYETLTNNRVAVPEVKTPGGKSCWPFFLPMVENGSYLGEDFAFCSRVREAGYRIYADTTIRLLHIGRYAYGWEELAGVNRVPGCTVNVGHPK
jgi:hypothetical protein